LGSSNGQTAAADQTANPFTGRTLPAAHSTLAQTPPSDFTDQAYGKHAKKMLLAALLPTSRTQGELKVQPEFLCTLILVL
jgi:hypothetical protein